MKKRNYIKIALPSLIAMTFLSSCLKDSRFQNQFGNSPNVIELPVSVISGEFQAASFPISTTPGNLPLLVNLASPTTSSSAITVKFKIDQPALDAYNTANGTSYQLLPAADYSSTLQVVIPAGQRQVNLNIAINSSLIDPSVQYALPITISDPGSGNVISANYKTEIFSILIKNKYDGEYTVTGTLSDNTDATITGAYPEDVDLLTQGAASAAFFDIKGGAFQHTISTSAGPSAYGSFAPVFTFDANNNVTSVTNYYGQFSGSHARSAVLDPSGINKFTSGTPGTAGAVFQVSYFMEQGNPGAVRTSFTETFTYVGPSK